MRLTAPAGSRPEISFTTQTSRVGSEGIIGTAGVAANLVHHPGKLDGVHAAATISYEESWRSSATPRLLHDVDDLRTFAPQEF